MTALFRILALERHAQKAAGFERQKRLINVGLGRDKNCGLHMVAKGGGGGMIIDFNPCCTIASGRGRAVKLLSGENEEDDYYSL